MKKTVLSLGFLLLPLSLIAQANLLITYHSETGNTERMAQAVAKGARSVPNLSVSILPIEDVNTDDLLKADAIILGSPVHNANVSTEIQQFISSWPFENEPLKDKIGAVFVTGSGISAGEEIVQMNMIQSMLVFGMIVVGGPDWTQPFGASAVTGEAPFDYETECEISDQFLKKAEGLGRRVAEIAAALKGKENP